MSVAPTGRLGTARGRRTRVEPPGLYKGDVSLSLAVRVGNQLFVSGIPPFDASGAVATDDFPAQMRQVLDNIETILAAADADWRDVVRLRVHLVRSQDIAAMNRLIAERFPERDYPTRTTTIVAALPRETFLLEIDCDVVLEPGPAARP